MRKINLTILSTDEIEEFLDEDENENIVCDPPCDKHLDSTDLNHGSELPPMYVLCTNALPEGITEVVCGRDDMDNWYFWWTKMPVLAEKA